MLLSFLFAIVMYVVCGDIMEGLLFESLNADDLLLMAESTELQSLIAGNAQLRKKG
jgi:hypothetical protein